jgi:hypothetical protein
MSMETFLVIVFLGGSLWAWAKWEREKGAADKAAV